MVSRTARAVSLSRSASAREGTAERAQAQEALRGERLLAGVLLFELKRELVELVRRLQRRRPAFGGPRSALRSGPTSTPFFAARPAKKRAL